MSYILDALRKADAQRERDPARGIHAQPLAGAAETRIAPRRRKGLAVAAAAVVGVCAVAAGAWLALRPDARAPQEPVIAAAPGPQSTPATGHRAAPENAPPPAAQILPPPQVVAAIEARPAAKPPARPTERGMQRAPSGTLTAALAPDVVPVQATGPMAMQASQPAPLIAAPMATGQPPTVVPPQSPAAPAQRSAAPGMQPLPQTTLQQPTVTAPVPGAGVNAVVPQPMNRAAPMRPSGPVAANPTQRAASAIPPSQPLPPVQGLPADAPKLVINGGVYSAAKDQRMLIVNGQVVREGADLGSGVKLEQITARTAVLSFRGARYSVSY